MTQTGEETKRPGTGMMRAGLYVAVAGLLMLIVILANGGKPNLIWLVLGGLVLAGIGYARRVLAALERR
jgi:hypothetical protein